MIGDIVIPDWLEIHLLQKIQKAYLAKIPKLIIKNK